MGHKRPAERARRARLRPAVRPAARPAGRPARRCQKKASLRAPFGPGPGTRARRPTERTRRLKNSTPTKGIKKKEAPVADAVRVGTGNTQPNEQGTSRTIEKTDHEPKGQGPCQEELALGPKATSTTPQPHNRSIEKGPARSPSP